VDAGHHVDLTAFYDFASQDAKLNQLAHRFCGAKPPRFPSVFEALVNGISCQQLSLTVGVTLLNRLAEYSGLTAGSSIYCFPRPEDLVITSAEFRGRSYSGNKSRALLATATRERSVIMCAEAVPWRCQRSLIADALVIRGIRVKHIMSVTRANPHMLAPFASVHGTHLTPLGRR